MKRNNKLSGIGNQFFYIMRDEATHLAFGADLTQTIIKENPAIWTDSFKKEIIDLVRQAVILEQDYAKEACPQGILGINAEEFCKYVEYVADRRLERLGISTIYQQENPFPWMSEAGDLAKEENFFEGRSTEYQTGKDLSWDD